MSLTPQICASAHGCTRHAQLVALMLGGPRVDTAIDALAGRLRAVRSRSPRRELIAVGSALAERFTPDSRGHAGGFDLPRVLRGEPGAPVVLAAIAASASREAGIAISPIAGRDGQLHLAHALLAVPLVLDVAGAFRPLDVSGAEARYRWLCAHGTAERAVAERAAARARQPVAAVA